MRTSLIRTRTNGFTLIELMVVVAVASVILMLAAPSFRNMIEMQRLRAAKSQLVTDMQFARSEAVARNQLLRVSFRHNSSGTMTCYTLYTAPSSPLNLVSETCNCLLGVGSACPAGSIEVRTVQHPSSMGVRVREPDDYMEAFAFDPITGGIYSIPTDDVALPMDNFVVDAYLDAPRKFRVVLGRSGRPQVCKPSGSNVDEPACP